MSHGNVGLGRRDCAAASIVDDAQTRLPGSGGGCRGRRGAKGERCSLGRRTSVGAEPRGSTRHHALARKKRSSCDGRGKASKVTVSGNMRLGVTLACVILLASCGAGDVTSNSVSCTCAHAAGVCIDVMRSLYGAATADLKGSPLTALRGLAVRQCHLKALRNSTFRPFARLLRLDLSYCLVRQVDDFALGPLVVLQELNLRGNLLRAVTARWFIADNALKRLDVSSNNVSALQADAFVGLSSLEALDLSRNKLSAVPPHAFRGLPSLRNLDLSANALTSMSDGCFSPLVSLQRLNLSDNRLMELGDGALSAGLATLRTLDASRNNLYGAALQWLGGLADLSLADNAPLRRLLLTGGRLRTVDAARSGLTHIPAALTRSVRVLLLAGNTVVSVRCGDADSYPLLAVLDLADNGLREVEEDALGRLEFLATLDLSHNELATPPRSLPASLRSLSLQGNPIRTLGAADFQGLPRLETLSVRGCGLLSIAAGSFAGLTALRSLDLSDNPLTLPFGAISGPLGLVAVNMSRIPSPPPNDSDTAVTAFPVVAPERMEVLELEGSPGLARLLLEDGATLAASGQTSHLDLRNTGLDALRSDLPHFFPRLKVLRLSGNPWSCAKDILWLAAWLSQLRDRDGALCSAPQSLVGTALVRLSRDRFANATEAPPEFAEVSQRENMETSTAAVTETDAYTSEKSRSSTMETSSSSSSEPSITSPESSSTFLTDSFTIYPKRSSESSSISGTTSTDVFNTMSAEYSVDTYSEESSTEPTVSTETFGSTFTEAYGTDFSGLFATTNSESSSTLFSETSGNSSTEIIDTTAIETSETISSEKFGSTFSETSETFGTTSSGVSGSTPSDTTRPMVQYSNNEASSFSHTIPSEASKTMRHETSSELVAASTTMFTTKSGRVLLNITVLSEGSTRGYRKAEKATSRVIRVIPAQGASNEALYSPQQPSGSGSHPGMFVLLAVGAAAIAALGAALPHLARRRARSYQRQQDSAIEVSAMSDLW